MSVAVVPDSGTAQLAGQAGGLIIKVEAGKHFYLFKYMLLDLP